MPNSWCRQPSAATYRALIETTQTGYVIIDTRGKVLDANREYVHLSGHRKLDEIRGRSVLKWTADCDKRKNADAIARCAETGRIRNLEIHYMDKRGRLTPVEIDATVVRGAGKPTILSLCRDISERKKNERTMRVLQFAMDQTPDAVLCTTKEGRLTYANPAACRRLGYTKDELLTLSIWDIDPDFSAAKRKVQWPKLKQQGSLRFEARHRSKDGNIVPVEVMVSHIDFEGEEFAISFSYDATARKQAEEELRLHREITTRIYEGITLVRVTDHKIIYANPKLEEMFGYGPGELLGKSIDMLHAPAETTPKARVRGISARLRQHGSWQGEIPSMRKDGTRFWCHAAISSGFRHHKYGEVDIATRIDITERKQAEEALRHSQALLAEAERLAGIGSIDLNIQAKKVYRSDGILHIFGVTRKDLPDKPEAFLKYVLPEDLPRVKTSLYRSVRRGFPFNDDYRIRRPDGTVRIIHAEGKVDKDVQGRPVRFFAWLQDITERRRLEEKVLLISDRERRRIGHDLHDDLGQRLTGIALLGRAMQDRLHAQASAEASAITELLRHVDHSLIHVRELSRGLTSVPSRPEGLFEALSGLAAQIRSTSRISCRLKADHRALIQDQETANHLYRIAQEAVHNAVRHARPQRIMINMAQNKRGLTLAVADDGIGIRRSTGKGGGMGLDIMRHRANLIHGTLSIASRSKTGTVVLCRIPRSRPANGNAS